MVISSLVISSSPTAFDAVCDSIGKMPKIEIVEKQDSKLAIVLETDSTEEAVTIASEIQSLDGILNVELVSHFFEDEQKQEENQ